MTGVYSTDLRCFSRFGIMEGWMSGSVATLLPVPCYSGTSTIGMLPLVRLLLCAPVSCLWR